MGDREPAGPEETSLRLFVVESTTRPGMLSVRVNLGDATATPFYRAITAAFEVGDVLEVRRMLRKGGQHREPADAVPGESPPAGDKSDEGERLLARLGQALDLSPDELCDIDDLPDCLVGGVHGAHCRHAGKPVTKGGNP